VGKIGGTYLYMGAKRAIDFAQVAWRYSALLLWGLLTSVSRRFAATAVSVSHWLGQIVRAGVSAGAKRAIVLAQVAWRHSALLLWGLLTSALRRFATAAISVSHKLGKSVRDGVSVWAKRAENPRPQPAKRFAHASREETAVRPSFGAPIQTVAKSGAALAAIAGMPHIPATRRPGLVRRPIPQAEEAVSLLRRLAKTERRAASGAVRS
jgi:hypothetical protein